MQKWEKGDKIGIISSGVSYQYVREIFPTASILKLGMTFPLPFELIKNSLKSVDKIYIIEEGEPYLEEQIKAFGIKVENPLTNLRIGELDPDRIEALSCEIEKRLFSGSS